jgi:hypothetical protein
VNSSEIFCSCVASLIREAAGGDNESGQTMLTYLKPVAISNATQV